MIHRFIPNLRTSSSFIKSVPATTFQRPVANKTTSSTVTSTARLVCRRTFTSDTEQQQQQAVKSSYTVKKRTFGFGTLLLCTIPFITFGLGTWQVQRLRWKVNLIERLEERMFLDPIPLPRRINQNSLDDYEYRRVKVKGTFRHDQEMLVGPRTRGDGVVGYFLITPLQREDGSVILVKRGWVASDKKDKAKRPDSMVAGPVEVEGLLRLTEKPNSFTPDNDPEGNQWYWVDLDTMAELSYSQNLLIESVSDRPSYQDHMLIEKGIPIGRSPVVEVRNSHMQYIITWYALSAATTVMLWTLLRKPPSRPVKIRREP
ncbi:SURF1 family-domain-containing protein [Absidia repens]|uniref:SURF1-like protein n=1 Tax=Absidia repens TaxID=90262 RepID=A0A1X2IVF1_9FUNG|nr:SURF1 family-domain-containing protein [Absidia repens]